VSWRKNCLWVNRKVFLAVTKPGSGKRGKKKEGKGALLRWVGKRFNGVLISWKEKYIRPDRDYKNEDGGATKRLRFRETEDKNLRKTSARRPKELKKAWTQRGEEGKNDNNKSWEGLLISREKRKTADGLAKGCNEEKGEVRKQGGRL